MQNPGSDLLDQNVFLQDFQGICVCVCYSLNVCVPPKIQMLNEVLTPPPPLRWYLEVRVLGGS